MSIRYCIRCEHLAKVETPMDETGLTGWYACLLSGEPRRFDETCTDWTRRESECIHVIRCHAEDADD